MAVGLIFGAKIIHANLRCKDTFLQVDHSTYCQSQLTLSACVRRKKLATGRNQLIGMLKVFQWGKSHKSLSSIQPMLIFQCENSFGAK